MLFLKVNCLRGIIVSEKRFVGRTLESEYSYKGRVKEYYRQSMAFEMMRTRLKLTLIEIEPSLGVERKEQNDTQLSKYESINFFIRKRKIKIIWGFK